MSNVGPQCIEKGVRQKVRFQFKGTEFSCEDLWGLPRNHPNKDKPCLKKLAEKVSQDLSKESSEGLSPVFGGSGVIERPSQLKMDILERVAKVMETESKIKVAEEKRKQRIKLLEDRIEKETDESMSLDSLKQELENLKSQER